MWDFLHCGQRPGRVKRLRSSNTYPQARQLAGVILTFISWEATERAICTRCSETSFSDIPTSPEISRALISSLIKRDMIFCRMVGIVVQVSYGVSGVRCQIRKSWHPNTDTWNLFCCWTRTLIYSSQISTNYSGFISSLSRQHAILYSGTPPTV